MNVLAILFGTFSLYEIAENVFHPNQNQTLLYGTDGDFVYTKFLLLSKMELQSILIQVR